jgi:hypothetical protein
VKGDEQQFQDLVILDGPHEIGSFTFRWPTGTEDFDCGWDLTVEAAGRRYRCATGWERGRFTARDDGTA